ncbi:MAG TPA: HD-GYP domain-containing protein [Desulfosporosinus sp.]|nr:HD-GYP domain-containing protein [Desulfosporosinus sp.]
MDSIRTLVSQCRVGTILAEDVITYQGITLVAKDCILNQYILNRLADFGIEYIWIYTVDELVPKQEKDKDRKTKKESIMASHAESVLVVKQVLRELSSGGKLNYPKIKQLSKLVYGTINNSMDIIESLKDLREKDEYTYTHCVNVAFYAMLIANWLNLAKDEIEEVIQAGLLHDIGKVLIPDEILNKPGKLSDEEFDIMRNHSLLGYFCIKDVADISQSVKEAVLSHHERSDGSGYPYGLQCHEIHLFAKIIAIADVYDAMTQDRIYKKGVNPFAVFEMFQTLGMSIFDICVLDVFLKNISLHFTGLNVILENGEKGEIVYVPPYEITRPVILKGKTFVDITQSNTKISCIV